MTKQFFAKVIACVSLVLLTAKSIDGADTIRGLEEHGEQAGHSF